MEELGGAGNVEKWVGIAPAAHGSATAVMYFENDFYKELLKLTFGWDDTCVHQLRPDSGLVQTLDVDGLALEKINRRHGRLLKNLAD